MATHPDEEKLLDHEYDGIHELDNPLPRWWINLFYVTIVFAIAYFVYYQFGYGDSLAETHRKDVQRLEDVKLAAKASAGTRNFKPSKARLEMGQKHFIEKCAACHKADGGGLVGPNLTDRYWVHGAGADQDLYDVIAQGVPEKGMLAWEGMLSPQDIETLVIFVQSLKGTNPPNAKAAEGTRY